MRITALIIVSLLFLTSCISITLEQQVNADGSIDTELIYDVRQLLQMAQSMGQTSELEDELPSDLCEQFRDGSEQEILTCTDEDGLVRIQFVRFESPFVTLNEQSGYTEYRYEIQSLDFLEGLTPTQSEDEIMPFDESFFSIQYIIRMPGVITSHSRGTLIDENAVRMNIQEFSLEEPVVIISRQEQETASSYALYIGITAAFILLVLLVTFFVIRGTHPKSKREPIPTETTVHVSADENKYKEYIETYKQQYSQEAIKQVLTQAGVTEEQATEYLKKYY